MIIKNNLKNLEFDHSLKINYLINNFLSLEMFNPIIKKNYFNKYDLKIFKKKKFRTHVFGMGGSSLSSKLLAQFLDPKIIGKNYFFLKTHHQLKYITHYQI